MPCVEVMHDFWVGTRFYMRGEQEVLGSSDDGPAFLGLLVVEITIGRQDSDSDCLKWRSGNVVGRCSDER